MSSSPSSPPAAASPRTPDALLEEIKSTMAALPPKARGEFVTKLQQLFPQPAALSIAPLTLKMLGIPENTPADANRLAPCLSALIEFVVKMDDTAWGAWKEYGADAKALKREVQMRALIKALVKGNSKLTVRQVEYQIANLMRLSVELLGQTVRIGALAAQFLRKFRPAEIEAEVEAQRNKLSLTSTEAQCWELFTKKWSSATAAGVQRTVNKEIAKTVAVNVKIQRLPV